MLNLFITVKNISSLYVTIIQPELYIFQCLALSNKPGLIILFRWDSLMIRIYGAKIFMQRHRIIQGSRNWAKGKQEDFRFPGGIPQDLCMMNGPHQSPRIGINVLAELRTDLASARTRN